MKKLIKNIVGEKSVLVYHYINSLLATMWYGFPSNKLIIVGITGTKGKTSTSEFTWSVLNAGGHITGLISTAHVRIGSELKIENMIHMTMPSPWITQKMLRKMINASCTHVVLEVSSEGLKQYRHIGINYDIGIFTNISPEHLPSHNNSFDEYKKAKRKLFVHMKNSKKKKFFPRKISIINGDSEHAHTYTSVSLDKTFLYSLYQNQENIYVDTEKNILISGNTEIKVLMPGVFNIYNALVAYYVGIVCGITIGNIKIGIENVTLIPGRMEELNLGQKYRLFIDYAHEKLSMENLLKELNQIKKRNHDLGKIILLFGAEGGGRDTQKRSQMAVLADMYANIIILSNVDPYEDNPQIIIEDIAKSIKNKIINTDLFLITDRREGINKAINLAEKNDIVCICGKGAEKTMIVNGQVLEWDERKIVRELLNTSLLKK